jgi:hypothetical protein
VLMIIGYLYREKRHPDRATKAKTSSRHNGNIEMIIKKKEVTAFSAYKHRTFPDPMKTHEASRSSTT